MNKSSKHHEDEENLVRENFINGLQSALSRGTRRMTLLDNICLIFLASAIYISLYYRSPIYSPLSSPQLFEQITVVAVCLFLCVSHRFHSHHANSLKHRDNIGANNELPMKSEKWTLALVTITLPLGLSLVSEMFGDGGILSVFKANEGITAPGLRPRIAQVAFHFSESVFFVMVTLEIAYLYDLELPEWRSLITASIVLNLIGFASFLLIGQPSPDKEYRSTTIIIIALSGIASLISSFHTILYARASKRIAGT